MCNNITKIKGNKEFPNTSKQKRNPITTKQWAKYISSNVAMSLLTINEDSPLYKSYWNTYYCTESISFDENGLGTSNYCKNRWCYTCNRIRTARLIKGYLTQLESFKESQFITLTRPTCSAKELPNRLKEMAESWKKITNSCRKKYAPLKGTDLEYKGLKKLECTLRPDDKYHPHYHIIVNTKEQADYILKSWLRLHKDADEKAQDIRPADKRSHKELFKYFTKLSTGKRKPGEALQMDYKRLDIVFQAMKGLVVFRAFGQMKMIKEDFEDTDLNATLNLGSAYANELFSWLDAHSDWLNKQTGELLVSKPIPTKVKALIPQTAEEKKMIEETNYLKPLTEFADTNDAFDLDEKPIHYNDKEQQRIQELLKQMREFEQKKNEPKNKKNFDRDSESKNNNQIAMAIAIE